MNWFRKLLLPLVPLYYLGALVNKKLFDWGIKKSTHYNFPLITVGNLSVGGTGKSPMVAYLINLLIKKKRVATLSRGYKRTSKGFQLAQKNSTVQQIGDEPLQFKLNFPNATVAVDADRRNGITQLFKLKESPEVVILDDAFQHRKVKAGLQILLTAYSKIYSKDLMLPTGDLREPISGAQRAQIIVVTKCPIALDENEKQQIKNSLKLKKNQHLFFTYIDYDIFVKNEKSTVALKDFVKEEFTLVTGIANPIPLVEYLNEQQACFKHLSYSDHYNFTSTDVKTLLKKDKILTTEKDFMRLSIFPELSSKLFYLPIKQAFLNHEAKFNSLILEFCNENYTI